MIAASAPCQRPAWRRVPGWAPTEASPRVQQMCSQLYSRHRRPRGAAQRPSPAAPAAAPELGPLGPLASLPTHQSVLDGCAQAWPDWARNAYRLLQVLPPLWVLGEGRLYPRLPPTKPGLVRSCAYTTPLFARHVQASGAEVQGAPTPQQAAAVLKALAQRALALPPAARRAALRRHRVVEGLAECLRVLPPREPVGAGPAVAQGSLPMNGEALGPMEVSSALWALGVLGEAELFQAEMDALLGLLPAVQFSRLLQVRTRGCAGSCAPLASRPD